MGANIRTKITRLSHAEAIQKVEPVVTAFTTTNPIPGPWPSFISTPEQMKEIFDRFLTVHKLAETGNHLSVAERNALRPGFNETFIDVADLVELAARKDETLPYRAGLEALWKAGRSSSHVSLNSLKNFTATNGPERATVIAKASGVPSTHSVEIQITYGDPTVEGNWIHFSSHNTASKMILRNLEVGKNCSLRARIVGSNEYGPWSQYISLIVT